MKKNKLLISGLVISTILFSCGDKKEEPKEETKTTEQAEPDAPVEEAEVASLTNPFPELKPGKPAVETGGKVFVITDIFNPGNKDEKFENINCTMIFAEAKEVNEKTTKVQPFSEECNVPNYFVVAIPQGQTAKKGDIVLAPWHHGESMKRAIVLDDKDPAQPIVNFIDVKWDNPAKGDNGVGYGQEQTQLAANSFYVITSAFTPGTTVALKEGTEWVERIVIYADNESALLVDVMGKITKVNKSDCKAIEVIPTVKAGEEVMAPWVGKFMKTKVIKLDPKFGRIYVKDPFDDKKPMILPYGTVTATL